MNSRFQTHYDVLGVKPGASRSEIERAHQRHVARLQDINTPPDARFEAKLREAHATLLDDEKRAAYDRFLLAPAVVAKRAGIDRRTAILGGAVFAIVAGGAAVWMRPSEKPAYVPVTPEQLQVEANGSVGRLSGIDLSGEARPIGVAFTSHEGVMTTVCRDMPPGAQLVVDISPRKVPARVQSVDEAQGFCTLAVDGGGSFPLRLSQAEPKAGDLVYVPGFDAKGALKLGQTRVKAVGGAPGGREFTLEAAIPPGYGGLPIFDAAGRVVLVADAQNRIRAIPPSWMDIPEKAAPKPAAPDAASTAPSTPADRPPPSVIPTSPTEMTPERKKALEEAFRPPPKVPDDL
jgi:hypothetical protein